MARAKSKHIALQTRLESVFTTIMDEGVVPEPVDPSRLNRLRISSFPFCGRQWFLNLPAATSKTRRSSAMASFFTGIGTSVHTTMQTAIENVVDELSAKHVWAIRDWVCRNEDCKCVHVYVPKPDKCKACGSKALKGIEHTVKHLNYVVGHIDETLGLLLNKAEVQITSDYKTTSASAIDSGRLPHAGNVAQIEAYAAIKHSQGNPVIGWCLIYICRDNPTKRKVVVHVFEEGEVEAILKRVAKYEVRYVKAREAYKHLDAEAAAKLTPDCKEGAYDSHCQFARVCEGGRDAVKAKCKEVVVTLTKRKEKERGKKV